MKTQHHGTWILCMKAITHECSPHATCGTKFGNLFKQVVMTIKKEGKLTGKGIDIESSIECSLHIANGIGKCKSYLLHCRGPSLANVIATDANGVPARQMLGAIVK